MLVEKLMEGETILEIVIKLVWQGKPKVYLVLLIAFI